MNVFVKRTIRKIGTGREKDGTQNCETFLKNLANVNNTKIEIVKKDIQEERIKNVKREIKMAYNVCVLMIDGSSKEWHKEREKDETQRDWRDQWANAKC